MNERIKELAEQAAQLVRIDYSNAYWRMQNDMPEDEAWRSKFAELLIKECANRGSEAMGPTFDPDYVGRKIREHFGLE